MSESDSSLEGTNSIISNLSSISLDSQERILEHLPIKRIKFNRNKPRMTYGKYRDALAFDVVTNKDTSIIREPIQSFINLENKIIYKEILQTLIDYKETARLYPYCNRCCLMCLKKVHYGNIFCKKHSVNNCVFQESSLDYSVNNED